jgi:hypothetical protein
MYSAWPSTKPIPSRWRAALARPLMHGVGHRFARCAAIRRINTRTAEEAMELTAVLTPAEEGGFVALNPEAGTTTQGETVEEAIANLREATAL